jgi:hypothetical protein
MHGRRARRRGVAAAAARRRLASTNSITVVAMAADEHTAEYAEAMNEAIASATRAEDERDAAKAEVASLKRKYEPDTGILLSKMLRLEDEHSTVFLRVTVRTGEYLLLELVPRAHHLPHYPNWQFYPSLAGKRDNMQDFSEYGTYEIHIGNEHHGDQHDLLVAFGKPATVDITVVTTHDGNYGSGEDEMIIEEVTTPAAVTLAMTDDAA